MKDARKRVRKSPRKRPMYRSEDIQMSDPATDRKQINKLRESERSKPQTSGPRSSRT